MKIIRKQCPIDFAAGPVGMISDRGNKEAVKLCEENYDRLINPIFSRNT